MGYFWWSSPGDHRENQSESDDGGRRKWRAAEAFITNTNESRNTDDESPRGSRSILIRGPCVCTPRTSVEVKGSPPKTALSGWGTSPPKPIPGTGVEGVSSP